MIKSGKISDLKTWTFETIDTSVDGYQYNLHVDSATSYECILEPQFFAELVEKTGLPKSDLSSQYETAKWPERHEIYAAVFKSRTREEWCALFEGSDACVAPVLDFSEVADHAHNKARGIFQTVNGTLQAAPAPRFDRTPAGPIGLASAPGEAGERILAECGFHKDEISALKTAGVLT